MKKSLGIALALLAVCGAARAQYLITTVAGGGLPPTAAPATASALPQPQGIVVDGSGNAYFAAANCVFKVDASGVLTRVAGGQQAGYAGDNGPAVNALLAGPEGLALDGAGNLYIADTDNNVIRKVTASTGIITTVAGNGTPGYTGNGGAATSAQLRYPFGVAVDHQNNLYIADTYNNRIREVTAATGVISTVAGTAFSGYYGDGGEAVNAELNYPEGVAVDASGNIYIADTSDNAVREVSNGIINTVAGVSGVGIAGYTGNGAAATAAELNAPTGVAVDGAGDIFIADSANNVIREVTFSTGNISTVAGNNTAGYAGDGSAATSAELDYPEGIAVDSSGNLYISDSYSHAIRKVAVSSGDISTIAGSRSWGDGGPATAAILNHAYGVAVDSHGNLYIADRAGNRIRKVTVSTGTITTVAGNGVAGYSGDSGPATSAEINGPLGVAVDSAGDIFIADTNNNAVREVAAASGNISTVAGNGTAGYTGDHGAATSATLQAPTGVAVDGSGNLYIADDENSVIRKVAGGTITTAAGIGAAGYSGDGGEATAAELSNPVGLAVDSSGNVYIADTGNHRIRELTVANGNINLVAGDGTAGYTGDGAAATSAELNLPYGVAVDSNGNVFIADTANQTIREVTASNGYIATIAGVTIGNNRPFGYTGDGGAALSARINYPYDVAVDSTGNVYVADEPLVRLLAAAGARALLGVTQTPPASLLAGQTGATYSVTVANASSAGATSGTVTVTDTVSSGLTLASLSGTGWSCSGGTCTRSDALAGGSSYPAITATVNVSSGASAEATNAVSVSGGGSPDASSSSATAVTATPAPALVSPANGAAGVLLAPTLMWSAFTGATSYDVYFGASSTPSKVTNTTETSYAPGALSMDTTYYWQVVAQTASGPASSPVWSFTTGAAVAALQFVPVTPCRVADTRNANGPFGGPTMGGNTSRSFAIPQSACNIPATAQAYSLNVTVVPKGELRYLTLWPTGQEQPFVSTLNSFEGTVVANAAIVPAGTGGAVSVYVTDATDVVIDINGYFDSTNASASSFYAATPCRVADTRNATGTYGGPSLGTGGERDFPIPASACAPPSSATAFSLNVTAVPQRTLQYLTAWPTGETRPFVSTLNSWTGTVVANAALVPAGTNGSVSIYVTDPSNVILDLDGYFGPPGGAGALSFYPVTPCRVADTRNADGPFGGPGLGTQGVRSFAIPASPCYVPPTAVAYSVNITVVPSGTLGYITVWPTGQTQPYVSTLNSFDGAIVANAAIVPAGAEGAISIYASDPTEVIVDINGYFAP
jgi:sugar lactone lactonase YvrE